MTVMDAGKGHRIATLTATSTGGAFTAGGTWVGGVAPTAADDAVIGVGTVATVTIDSGSVCRSLDCNGFINTLSHSAGVTLTIGDATAGLGNRALRLASGMTYTLGNSRTSAISFISTSATVQSITLAGKSVGDCTFNAASNGSWQHADAVTAGVALITITKGTWDANTQTITAFGISSSNSNVRSVTVASCTINLSSTSTIWDFSTATNLTFSGSGSTINHTGSGTTFNGGGKTFGTFNWSPSAPNTFLIGGANTFATLAFTGSASKTDILELSANQTVTGTLTLAGNSAVNRILVRSDTLGTARTITNSGATMTWSNVDFRDIALGTLFDASAITGKSGDCGGCSNITFTVAAGQTWFGTSGGNWSANSWSGRVPLPQDDVTINQAFSASQTITADMPRLGKSITFANTGNSVAWAKTLACTMYGSLVMTGTSLMTNSGTTNFTFEGRGAFTLTSAGQTFTNPITIQMVGGKLTHQDAFTDSHSNAISLNNGEHDWNGFNGTLSGYFTNVSTTRTLTLGTGTLTLTGSAGNVFSAATSTGLTVTPTTGTIALTAASAGTFDFAGGGKSYGVLSVTTGGAGSVRITNTANTFIRLVCPGGAAKAIVFPGGLTTTFNGTNPFPSGAAGNLLTFTSSSGTATLAFTSQAVCNYISLTDVAASTGPQIAGANSTLSGVTTNWVLSAAAGPGFLLRRHQLSGGFAAMGM